MKKTMVILGAVMALSLIAVLVVFYNLHKASERARKSATAYVDTNVPEIVKDWNPGELMKRAAPELLNATSRQQLAEMFRSLSVRLGSLKEYRGSTGDVRMTDSPGGKVVTGTYRASAVFEKGPAEILCRMVYQVRTWKIQDFRVNPGPPAR